MKINCFRYSVSWKTYTSFAGPRWLTWQQCRRNRGGGAGGHVLPTFLEIAVVTLENNAAQKNVLFHAPPPPPKQFPSYGSGQYDSRKF